MTDYPRDLKGYGRAIPDPKWPDGARIAVQFVLNYEEGAEYSIPDGDGNVLMSEISNCSAVIGVKDALRM